MTSTAQTIIKLDLTACGIDPSDFEGWRKNVFASILANRSTSNFAGAALAYERGTIDMEILKDSECPGTITAIYPMQMFMGNRFMGSLTKDQVYANHDLWVLAGRPGAYAWPAAAGQPVTLTVASNDPCHSVLPREHMSALQRQRLLAEGRYTDWKPYKRCMDGAFAVVQAHMTEAMNIAMGEIAVYSRAVNSGDLLAAMHEVKIKAVCGNRLQSVVINQAVRDAQDPRHSRSHQKTEESEEEYTSRFKKIVQTAHTLRVLDGTPLSETDCVRGLFHGLKSAFDVVKLEWQYDADRFATLDDAIKRVKEIGRHISNNKPKADESAKRKVEDTPAEQQDDKRRTGSERQQVPATHDSQLRMSRFRNFRRMGQQSIQTGHILYTGDQAQDDGEDLFTTEQVSQLIEEAVTERTVLIAQSHASMLPSVNQAYTVGVPTQHQVFYNAPAQPQMSGGFMIPRQLASRSPCRHFFATGMCGYGNDCRFSHATPENHTVPSQGGQQGAANPSAASTVRINPFAARPNK